MVGYRGRQIGRIERGDASKVLGSIAGAKNEFGAHLLADAPSKVFGGGIIDRDGDHARNGTCQKNGNPFGAVGTPDKYRIAFHDVAGGEFAGELVGDVGYVLVRPALVTISAGKDIGWLCFPSFELVEKIHLGTAGIDLPAHPV